MKKLIIYYTPDKKCWQIVKPTAAFDQDWKALADQISGGRYYKFEII